MFGIYPTAYADNIVQVEDYQISSETNQNNNNYESMQAKDRAVDAPQRLLLLVLWFQIEIALHTIQKDKGRKKMLTKVRSLIFSPSLVEARLSMTPLALNSYQI